VGGWAAVGFVCLSSISVFVYPARSSKSSRPAIDIVISTRNGYLKRRVLGKHKNFVFRFKVNNIVDFFWYFKTEKVQLLS